MLEKRMSDWYACKRVSVHMYCVVSNVNVSSFHIDVYVCQRRLPMCLLHACMSTKYLYIHKPNSSSSRSTKRILKKVWLGDWTIVLYIFFCCLSNVYCLCKFLYCQMCDVFSKGVFLCIQNCVYLAVYIWIVLIKSNRWR